MGRQSRMNPFAGKTPQDPIIPTAAYDRLGRQLQVGDIVYLLGKFDVMWQVMEVAPMLHPGAPPGAMRLTFAATFQPTVPGGQRILDVLTVSEAEAPVEAALAVPRTPEQEEMDRAIAAQYPPGMLDEDDRAEAGAVGTETPLPSGPRRIVE